MKKLLVRCDDKNCEYNRAGYCQRDKICLELIEQGYVICIFQSPQKTQRS